MVATSRSACRTRSASRTTSRSSAPRPTISRTPCSGVGCADLKKCLLPAARRLRASAKKPSIAGRLKRLAAGAIAGVVVVASAMGATLLAQGATSIDPGLLPAEAAPLSPKSLLLDIAHAGSRFVAVGERGHVL